MMKIIELFETTLPYSEILSLQKAEFQQRVEARKTGKELPEDVAFIVEHRPVITLGRHGKETNLLFSENLLAERGIEYVAIDRGGDITYHGPGQLTVYPIVDLLRLRMGLKDYIHNLEEAVIRTIAHFGIQGERIEGKTGVWVRRNEGNVFKISAIGVRCSRFVTMHGLALNVGMDLSGFNFINPCGLGLGVTSLSRETGRDISLRDVSKVLAENLIYLLQPRILSQGNS